MFKQLSRRATAGLMAFAIVLSNVILPVGSAFADAKPPGNNSSIKICQPDGTCDNANEPHVQGCTLSVEFFGYDAGQRTGSVTFDAQAPTAGQLVSPIGPQSVSFTGSGTGNHLDYTKNYTLSFSGQPQQNQGYHVEVTVAVDGSQGNDTKTKTIWVEGCTPTPATPVVSVTPTACSETDSSDGTATATITNPADNTGAAVMYSWSVKDSTSTVVASGTTASIADGASTTVDLSGLAPGSYTMTITGSDGTTSSTTFSIVECSPQLMPVTPVAPTVNDVCGTVNDSITLPENGNGITYTASAKIGNTIVVTATPDATHEIVVGTSGYVLQADGTATFTVTFTNNAPCPVPVTPPAPTPVDLCYTDRDGVQIPVTDGVSYYVNGGTDDMSGAFVPFTENNIVVTAAANEGFVFTDGATTSWTFGANNFTNQKCLTITKVAKSATDVDHDGTIGVGDTITWEVTVTNTSSVDYEGFYVTVDDTNATLENNGFIGFLGAGDSVTLTATSTITLSQVLVCSATNTATFSGWRADDEVFAPRNTSEMAPLATGSATADYSLTCNPGKGGGTPTPTPTPTPTATPSVTQLPHTGPVASSINYLLLGLLSAVGIYGAVYFLQPKKFYE